MRRSLLNLSMIAGTFALAGTTTAQQADRFAYVVTDMVQQGANWQFLRKMDLRTGTYSQVMLNGTDVNYAALEASSRKPLKSPLTDTRYGNYVNAPFATGVAAIAYDRKNNRLYYTPMLFDQLRYVDLKTMKVYYVTDQVFTGKPVKSSTQGDIVTRMVIASDGNGYAMTNDATQLIQFTTGKKMQITDLGSIVDDPANKISIHNSCSSFGGDMIADDNKNLYVFSARNQVFKVDIETKVAIHLGHINGLPQGFTVNGAVVNDRNEIVVASAVQAANWYTVDLSSLSATEYKLNGELWQSSDLGNSNVLVTKKAEVAAIQARPIPMEIGDGKVSVYPNPVTGNQFTVQFNTLEEGTYTVQVTDMMGRQVQQQVLNVSGDNFVQTISLAKGNAKGIYLVKVLDSSSKSVFSTKLIVQ
jgi:hypothetical protein